MAEELRRLGWREKDLAERRKSDPDKLVLAARLRLGSWQSANVRLHAWMAAHPIGPAAAIYPGKTKAYKPF